MSRIIFLFMIFFVSQLYSTHHDDKGSQNYKYNPNVPKDLWESLEQYFLPSDHPIKKKLDQIFSKNRATQNRKTLTDAHFRHIKEGLYTGTICARHPKIDGFVIKLYYDDGPKVTEWQQWINRIKGANAIREAIGKHKGYDKIFKVARKWIYPLPAYPSSKDHGNQKNFILVAEDMHIWRTKDSLRKWKNSSMTPLKLNALYKLLKEVGLSDSVYAFNIPFARDGRVTFIDTEIHHSWPIHFEKLLPYLAPKMQEYWLELTQK